MNITLKPAELNRFCDGKAVESFDDYEIRVSESSHIQHYHSAIIENALCGYFGSLFEKWEKPIEMLHTFFKKDRASLFNVDGSFLYFEITKDGKLAFFSERDGLTPVYYRTIDGKIIISTRCDLLFDDFTENSVDYSALYDYLRYGMLIGDHTFSTQVKLLQGGSYLYWNGSDLETRKLYFFKHDSANEEKDVTTLIEQLDNAYLNAIKKRVDRPVEEISVFLSGGMDSRLVLSATNTIFNRKKNVSCSSFGMPKSEEVDIARKIAEIKNNRFISIDLVPEDHLKNAKEYAIATCGSDMSAQSYIIGAADRLKNNGITAFMTGSFLECHIGGTFLPESAQDTDQKLSEYLPENIGKVKCELFKDEELKRLLNDGAYEKYFKGLDSNLVDESKKYDEFPVKDIIQSFVIDNRDKRLVLNREIVPGQSLDYINPNFDIDFLKVASHIPAKERAGRKFYREYMVSRYPEYAAVVYNNTTLPVSAPIESWKVGSGIEAEREKLFAELQQKAIHEQAHTYYPHFYSDFDGYSRYNSEWITFFNHTLLSENGWLVGRIVSREKVKEMLEDHLACRKNYRKKLLNLASLELFFDLYFRK